VRAASGDNPCMQNTKSGYVQLSVEIHSDQCRLSVLIFNYLFMCLS